MRRGLLAAGACAVAALALAAPAHACTCIPLSPDSVGAKEAAIVAKLKSVEPHGGGSAVTVRADFRFKVLDVLKGKKRVRKRKVVVRSVTGPGASAACGLAGQVGKRYGLVITRRDRRWFGSSCGQTSPRGLRDLFSGPRPAPRGSYRAPRGSARRCAA